MARYNPLVFPDPNYVQEFTPPPAEDGTVIGKTWYWTEATTNQDTGHWELRQTEVKEMAFAARKPMTVRRKVNVSSMNTESDVLTDTIVYGFSMADIDQISYSYTFNMVYEDDHPHQIPVPDPNNPDNNIEVPVVLSHYVINGYHNPKLVLIRGNKYTFDYSQETTSLVPHIYFSVKREGRIAYSLFEEGVVRDETEKTMTFTVPGTCPPKLVYGPQPELFDITRTGEISIENKVTL